MLKLYPLLLSVFFILSYTSNITTAQNDKESISKIKFHPPHTEAEKALEAILSHYNTNVKYEKQVEIDGFITSIIRRKKIETKPAKSSYYHSMFTNAFLHSTTEPLGNKKEQRGYDLLLCGLEYSDIKEYHTYKHTKDEAFIVYTTKGKWQQIYSGLYKMVNDNGTWKLDGVDCKTYGNFNLENHGIDFDMSTSVFHEPQTDAEKAFNELLDRDHRSPPNESAEEYFRFRDDHYTQKLLEVKQKTEDDAAEADCPTPEDREGSLCGFEFNTLTCAQDWPDFYLYKTINQTENEAMISIKWNIYDDSATYNPYRMVKQDGKWKLDGIDCGFVKFNMP